MKITLQHLRTKPGDKPIELRDDSPRGLILRIQPTGVKTWYFQFERGRRIRIGRADIITLEQARTQAKALAVNPDATITTIRPKKTGGTFGEFIDEHYAPWCKQHHKASVKTLRQVKANFEWLYKERLNGITVAMIEKWRTGQLNAGRATKTVNNRIGELTAILTKAVEWGELKEHPITNIKPMKVDNARVRWLKPDEEKRVTEELRKLPKNDLMRCAVIVSLNTGIRKGELLALEWADIDLEGHMLTVRAAAAKSSKTRHISLNADALSALTARKGQTKPFDIADSTHWSAWDKFATAAKLDDFHWHDLRHDFASKLVMAGVDLNTVRELMGHSTLTMTLRYAHLAPEHKAAAVAKLRRVGL